jgi:pimeloyl-ACP methyl ester carboxylesterase
MKNIEKNEHFIKTESGIEIYTIEKRLKGTEHFKTRNPVLLIHGVGVGCAYFDIDIRDYSMMNYLAQEGFDVFAVDQKGYGKSTQIDGTMVRADSSADDLKSVIDFIKDHTNSEKVDLVGHSWGGIVSVVIAGKYQDDIGKVVLIGMPYKRVKADFQGILDFVIEQAKSGEQYIPNTLHETVEDELYSYEKDAVDFYHKAATESYPMIPTGPFLDMEDYEYSKYIPEITVPTLLVTGEADEVIEPVDLIQCLHNLGAVEKDLMFIGNAWHLVFFEKEAHSRQNIAVRSWLLQ